MELERDPAGSPPADSNTLSSDAIAGSSPVVPDVQHEDPSTSVADNPDPNTGIVDEPEEYSSGLMDAITEASGEPEDLDVNEPAEQEAEAKQEGAPEGDPESEAGTEEESDEQLPFNKHPRFRQLISERNEYRNMAEEYRPSAEEYRKIETYMASNELRPEEVAQGFELMAMMKRDPFTARERMIQYVQMLDKATGRGQLPQELHQEVQQGYITEQRARELAEMRNRTRFTESRAQYDAQRQQQAWNAQQQQQAFSQRKNAVSNWEGEIKAKDPDYGRLQPWVFKELRLLSQDQPPQTPQDAVALAQQAYQNVKNGLRKLNPQRPGTLPTARSEQSASGQSAGPQPGSMLEAVLQAAGQ